jgi:hypothetical protein
MKLSAGDIRESFKTACAQEMLNNPPKCDVLCMPHERERHPRITPAHYRAVGVSSEPKVSCDMLVMLVIYLVGCTVFM